MGSLLPILHRPHIRRLYFHRGLCTPIKDVPPPGAKDPSPDKRKDPSWNVEVLQKEISDKIQELRDSISPTLQKTQGEYIERANFWMRRYEKYLESSEVQKAQRGVIMAEEKFIDAQKQRREMHAQISELQSAIKGVHSELEKTGRGEDRYLDLLTHEHKVIKEEKICLEAFKQLEAAERDYFSQLSIAVRDSHEKERAQAQKTKYLSIIGSIVASILTLIGSAISNRLRMREIRDLVERSISGRPSDDALQHMPNDFTTLQKNFDNFTMSVQNLLMEEKKSLSATSAPIPSTNSEYSKALSDLQESLDSKISQIQKTQNLLVQANRAFLMNQSGELKDLNKQVSALSSSLEKEHKEILSKEDALRDRFKDITSFLLSQPWNSGGKAVSSRIVQSDKAPHSEIIPFSSSFIVIVAGATCVLIGISKLFFTG